MKLLPVHFSFVACLFLPAVASADLKSDSYKVYEVDVVGSSYVDLVLVPIDHFLPMSAK